jgi:hypothetical protein
MSRYPVQPHDLGGVHTYHLKDRKSKVDVGSFGRPHIQGGSVS